MLSEGKEQRKEFVVFSLFKSLINWKYGRARKKMRTIEINQSASACDLHLP